jgi:hypothetical protein
MPVKVRDVLQMDCLSQARVVAGERGLDREVYWITVGEEPDLPEWVFGGELILSTLFAVEPERRDEYVKRLSDRGVAGLMLKPARFLGTIPQSVLEAADRESFPVAEVPIDVLWSRVLAGFYSTSSPSRPSSSGWRPRCACAGASSTSSSQGRSPGRRYSAGRRSWGVSSPAAG